jgi:ATP synthase protein I
MCCKSQCWQYLFKSGQKVLISSKKTLFRKYGNRSFEVFFAVAMHQVDIYNARAKLRPAWKERNHNATDRRLADGRGVFSAGGRREVNDQGQQHIPAFSVSPVGKVLLAQLGLSVVLATLFWGINGTVAGYSALLGGLTCVIPNAFLALRLVVPRRDPGPGALVRAAYIGEIGKLALTVLMFTIVFTLVRPLAAGALFAGFILSQLVTFSGFLMRDRSQTDDKRKEHGE